MSEQAKAEFQVQFTPDVLEYLHSTYESEHLQKLLCCLTSPPQFTTIRVNLNHDSKDESNESIVSTLQVQDILNNQCRTVDWKEFETFVHPALKDCLVVVNRGPLPLQKHTKEIVVDISCGMAVLRGAHVFKNGILGAPRGLKHGDAVSVYADLTGNCLKGHCTPWTGSKLHVGNGVSQVERADVFNSEHSFSGVGILMTHPIYEAPSLSDLPSSLCFPQNLPSILCGHVLDPSPEETILDMCAAPGGKTSHIATLMQDKGRVVALEKSRNRVAQMQELMGKMSFHCVESYVFDSTQSFSPSAESCGPPPYPNSSFDRILLDAPCSALGQRPCLVNKIFLKQLKSFPVVQHKLLLAARELLKPGGVLVYSTCSLPKEENEEQISWLVSKCPDMELVDIPFHIGRQAMPTVGLSEEQTSFLRRFDPMSHSNKDGEESPWDVDTIGFFIAKLKKRKEADATEVMT